MKIQIIQNTMELCHTYGIKALSMDDITQLSGVSKKILNSYFPNKESLLKACIKYRLNQEEVFKSTDDNLLDFFVYYAEVYPELYQKVNHRCCIDIKKYYPPVYAFLIEEITRYATICQNKVKEGIANGYIKKKTPPGLVYMFLQDHFSRLLNGSGPENPYMTELILAFTRGISTLKGRSYIDKKLKP